MRALTCALVLLATLARAQFPCGDITGDHAVNIGDGLLAAQVDVGLKTCAMISHPENCDVNHDAACNIGDALRFAQCDVGIFPCSSLTCSPPFACPTTTTTTTSTTSTTTTTTSTTTTSTTTTLTPTTTTTTTMLSNTTTTAGPTTTTATTTTTTTTTVTTTTTTLVCANNGTSGTFTWVRDIQPGAFSDGARVNGVATDTSNAVAIVGQVADTVDFGGGPVGGHSGGAWDEIFVAKYTPANGYIWAHRFGTAGAQPNVGNAVATDANRNVVATGLYQGTGVDAGCGALPSSNGGSQDIFVAKFDNTASGTCIWSKPFGGTSTDVGTGIATDSAGNVYVVGTFLGMVTFGATTLTSVGQDGFLLKLSGASGTPLWVKQIGGAGSDSVAGVAVDATDHPVIIGSMTAAIDFGAGPVAFGGGLDVFVARYDASGTLQWAKGYGGAGTEIGHGIGTDPAGNVVVTGQIGSSMDFGNGCVITNVSGSDVFAAKLNASGTCQWAHNYGDADTDGDTGNGIAADRCGNVVLTGNFRGTIMFDQVLSNGSGGAFLAKLTPGGVPVWSKQFDGPSTDLGLAVATDTLNNVIGTGSFAESADFGGGTITSPNGIFAADGYAAKYLP